MSLMETYLMVTCPVKGCSMHVETLSPDSELKNLSNKNQQMQNDSRSSESGMDSVVRQLDFWHSKTDH